MRCAAEGLILAGAIESRGLALVRKAPPTHVRSVLQAEEEELFRAGWCSSAAWEV